MDINDFLDNGVTINNPNYKKPTKRNPSGSPRSIQSGNYDDAIDRSSRIGSMLAENSYDLTGLNNDDNNYADYDVRINPVNTQEELNQSRAKNQSAWEQSGRALGQAVGNEIVLGTALGLSNLVDMGISLGKETGDNDYTNPFSTFLEGKQEEVKKALEIYKQNPNDNWQVGDYGWWADNAVSVASTLSMLIPSMAVTEAIGGAAKLARLEKVSMGIAKAAKGIGATEGAYTLSKAINEGAKIGTSTLLSRTMEGYLEARGVYKETYDKSLGRLANMSPEEKTKLIKNNPDFEGKSDEDIAKHMSSVSADETFRNDYAMLLFDFAQFKALGSMWKGLANKEVNSTLRAANKTAINALADDGASIVNKLGFLGKRSEAIEHALKHPLTSLGAIEFSEGLEEGYQGIQTEKGKEVAEKLFDPKFTPRTLESYLTDGAIWEQAFWGIVGGIGFQVVGTGLGNVAETVKGKVNKASMSEQEYALSQMTDEKVREQEINSRQARMQDYTQGMQLLNQGKNPFGYKLDPDTKQPILKDGSKVNDEISKDDADMLKTKLTNDFVTNMVLDATDKGNYELLKEYIKDPKFNQFFTEAGLTSDSAEKNFTNMLTSKMDQTYEQYHGALYDVLNSVDVENENVAKIAARSIARRKLDIADWHNNSDALSDQIANDADTNNYNDYEEKERLKYVAQRLKEIDAKETQIKQMLDNKNISPQAYTEIKKENDFRRNQLLAFGSTGNMFGNEDAVKTILSQNIEDSNANDFIAEFNKYISETGIDLFGNKSDDQAAPKKSIQDLIKKKVELDDHISYTEHTLPLTQKEYQKEYDDISRNVDRVVVDRYNAAADTVGKYLEDQPNLEEARDNVMTNNVPADIKEKLDILKLGHHSTQRYTSQINAIIKEITKDRAVATEEAKNVTVDNTTSNDNKASNDIIDIEDAVATTDNRPTVDEPSSTGELQQTDPTVTLEDTNIEPTQESDIETPVVETDPNVTAAEAFNVEEEIDIIEKSAEAIEQQRVEDYILDNDSRAIGLASSVTFNLFKTSRNLFDNLEGKDVNSAEFNNIVNIVADELFIQGVSRGYTRPAAVDGIKMALNMIYRRLSSKGTNADIFKQLADQLANKQRVEFDETGKASTTSLIPDGEFNQVVDAFIDSYIQNRGVYTLKGSKTIINVEDLFRELLNNDGITYDQAKHVFFNIADYIRVSNNSKYIFTNKTELNRNLKTPSIFFSNLINNKTTVDVIDTYMHIAAPSKTDEGYNTAIAEAVNGAPITISYYEGSFGSSTNSISIKRNGTEIGYLGSVTPNASNTGYTLKKQNQGFVYNIVDNNGFIESNLDKLFIPLINKENQQYSDLMDIAYKQLVYETAVQNNSASPEINSDDINKVLNAQAIKSLIANNELKIPAFKVTDRQKTQYILNAINNIIFFDSNAVTSPMIMESYSYWKSSTFNNYANTHKIQQALTANKKVNTKLVNIAAGKVLIDATNHDVNTIGFTYEQNPIMIVDANGNIVNERNNATYSNVAGFEAGTMGMLVADNPNAPIMALFTESNKLSTNKDLANRTYTEINELLNNFQSKVINFDTLGNALSDLFSGPGVKSNNIFSGYSVIKTSDRIALNIQGRKGEYALIVHKFEKKSNIEGVGMTYIPDGVREKSRSSLTLDKKLNNTIAREIVSNLTFNKTFYGVNNRNVDNDKSNRYLYKEKGKLIVNIGGKIDSYNTFGQFVLTNNAFKTNQGKNADGTFFDTKDKIKSLYINTAIINSPVEEISSIVSNSTATDIIKTASMTESVNTSQILNKAGVAPDKVAILTGTNEFSIELIPKESYFDIKATKAEAYYTKGKMYFTNKGANAISKSPNNLIRLLIHENLHAKFEDQGLFQQAGIVDDLMNTYNAMRSALDTDTLNTDAKVIQQWITTNKFNPIEYFDTLSAEQQRVWAKRSEEDRIRQFAEEWLVESLTQPTIIRYLNNTEFTGEDISVEGINNSAKSIWQKIIDVLLKLFGRNSGNIKNNTILAQQYTILGNTNDVITSSETNIEQTVKQNIDVNTPGETPLNDKVKDDVPILAETAQPIDDISVTGFQTESRKLDEESDIDDLDFAVTNIIEDSNDNPIISIIDTNNIHINNKSLSSIGNSIDYNNYINSLFPLSKVKDIVYHGTNNEFDTFEKGHSNSDGSKADTEGFHFIAKEGKEFFGNTYGKIKSVLLDFRNPIIDDNNNSSLEYLTTKTIDNYKQNSYDSGIITVDGEGWYEYIAFDSNQIHILGSPTDIAGFKDYMANNKYIPTKSVDDINIEARKDSPNVNMNGIQIVTNMNEYVKQFTEQDKPIIARMMRDNELKFRCE